jgi:hypothetical protein
MGEYAIRKSDETEIKIGTCEEMYYLRYEDRDKVRVLSGNVDPVAEANELRFRLPFPDEDGLQPGEYEDFARGLRLYRSHAGSLGHDDFEPPNTDPGTIQLHHDSGLLLNVPCYHGLRLPEVTAPMKAFWNGKSWATELTQLRPTPEGVKPIVHCRFCGHKWRFDWVDIWDYVNGADVRAALRPYVDAEDAARTKRCEALVTADETEEV